MNTPISPKVTSASAGAGVAVAVTTVAVWILEASTGVDVPALVEGAIAIVLGYAGAFLAGWVRPDPLRSSTPPEHSA